MSTDQKTCQNCKAGFQIEPEDTDFYEKIDVPPPTWCPRCRMRRRIMWRNERTMYKRVCDATGKEIFTHFHPNAPYKVYERDYWWSDKWDPMEYGKEVDFTRPFLEQVRELMLEVPWYSRSVIDLENSDYSMNCSYQKNCYLTFHGTQNEGCSYCVGASNSKDSLDILSGGNLELCFECFNCEKCYKVFYSMDCLDCQELYACVDCVNSSHCIGSVGLRSRKYCIFNEQYSKEDYFKKAEELRLHTYKGAQAVLAQLKEHSLAYPRKYMNGKMNTGVSGDYIYESKNVKNSFVMEKTEDCKHCQNILLPPGGKDSYDYSFFGLGAERMYEAVSCGFDVSNIRFSAYIYPGSQDTEYSIMCPSSEHLFGCVGMKKGQYCILNKQYSKEEYEKLREKVIAHMKERPYEDARGRKYGYGEFFPYEFCPFGYNETWAQEYFPMSKEEVLREGINWADPVERFYATTLSWKDLPEDIDDVEDPILKEVILCQAWDEEGEEKALEHNCSMAFKITPGELEFYKRMKLPLPRRCWNSRHYARTLLRNKPEFYHRRCQCAGAASEGGKYRNTASAHARHGPEERCPEEFETSYAPDRPEIVYCEQCYQAEVA